MALKFEIDIIMIDSLEQQSWRKKNPPSFFKIDKANKMQMEQSLGFHSLFQYIWDEEE